MERTAVTGGGTTAVISAQQFNAYIYRCVITGPVNSTFQLFTGAQFKDGSQAGNRDVAEYPKGLYWPRGTDLIGVWNVAGNSTLYVDYEKADDSAPQQGR